MNILWVHKAQSCSFDGTAPVKSCSFPKGKIFAHLSVYISTSTTCSTVPVLTV